MSEWQPIQTAPKDARVMLWLDGPIRAPKPVFGRWIQPANPRIPGFWMTEGGGSAKPTHWMPLPDPPILREVSPLMIE
jgi:hypothetical protein